MIRSKRSEIEGVNFVEQVLVILLQLTVRRNIHWLLR